MRRALAIAIVALAAACGERWEAPAPGFVLVPSGEFTTEAGGTASVEVSLAMAPTASVVVELLSGDPTEGAIVDPVGGQPTAWATLAFTPDDWSTPQRVTVVGIDDDARDGDVAWELIVVASGGDEGYAAADAASVSFTNRDDDTAAILLSRERLATWETLRITDSFTVSLAARPVSTVTVPIVSPRPSEGRLRSSTSPMIADPRIELVFTPSDWSTPREVIVVAQADGVVDGDQAYELLIGPATGDAEYASLPGRSVAVTNRDMDGIGVIGGEWLPYQGLVEGESTTLGFVLGGPPLADVAIPFASGDPGNLLLSTAGGAPATTLTLVFTPESWDQPQQVRFHAVQDLAWEPWGAAPLLVQAGPLVTEDEAYRSLGWSAAFDLYVYDDDVATAEGSAAQPLDLAGQLPWRGVVDSSSSHYRLPVGGDALLVVAAQWAWEALTVAVDDDGDFSSGTLGGFSSQQRGAILLRAPPSGEVFLRVDGGPSGALFLVELRPLQFAAGLPVPIPDGTLAGVDVPLTVSGGPTSLGAVTVAVKATHTFAYDLTFRLRSPAGTEITLVAGFYRASYSGGYPWTVFEDDAALGIYEGGDANGTFRPLVPLGSMAGEDANGVWTLHAVDSSNVGWSGQLEGWGIAFR